MDIDKSLALICVEGYYDQGYQTLLTDRGICLLVCVLYQVLGLFCRLIREQLIQLSVVS